MALVPGHRHQRDDRLDMSCDCAEALDQRLSRFDEHARHYGFAVRAPNYLAPLIRFDA
jgi:hypothetical protein